MAKSLLSRLREKMKYRVKKMKKMVSLFTAFNSLK